jgi:hypothetical protein
LLGNLIDHACTWAKSLVLVTLRDTENAVEILVEDGGAGTAPEDRALALARGGRLDGKVPGTGLGLSVVGDLVGLHRGTWSRPFAHRRPRRSGCRCRRGPRRRNPSARRLPQPDSGPSPWLMARKSKRKAPTPLPLLLFELGIASGETIARRSWMMAQGRCSAREQRRMVQEKSAAALASLALLSGPQVDFAELLRPWHKAATANAKRLRSRRKRR